MLGLWELWVLFSIYWNEFRLPRRALGALIGVVMLIISVPYAHRVWNVTRQERENQINEDGLRRVLGEWLHEHTNPDDVIATEAIGYQGYYSGRRLLDLAGLISPEVVDIMRCTDSHAETFHRVLSEHQPDYVVLRAYEVRDKAHFHGGKLFDTPEQHDYFQRHYDLAISFQAPLPEAVNWTINIAGEPRSLAELDIYRRRAKPSQPAISEASPSAKIP